MRMFVTNVMKSIGEGCQEELQSENCKIENANVGVGADLCVRPSTGYGRITGEGIASPQSRIRWPDKLV